MTSSFKRGALRTVLTLLASALFSQPAGATPHKPHAAGQHHAPSGHHAAASSHHGKSQAGHAAHGTRSSPAGRSGRTGGRSGRHGAVTRAELPLDTTHIDPARFDAASIEFLHGLLALTPVSASQAGYHVHTPPGGTPLLLDHALDDVSPAGYAALCAYQRTWLSRFDQLDARQLSDAQRADLAMLQDNLHLGLLDCHAVESFRHRPDQYAETLGQALFLPLSQDPDGTGDGVPAALDRLAQFARFISQAQRTLQNADPVYVGAASEEIAGTIELVQTTLRERASARPATAQRYAALAPAAVRALQGFDSWVRQTLAKRAAPRGWRMGGALYTQQFNYTMHAALSPDALLQQAEQEMLAVRADMLALALPQHQRLFPEHGDHADLAAADRQNRVIREVLDTIADDHESAANLRTHIEADLGDIAAFIRNRNLLTLGATDNLKVIDTPVFLRASYGVAGFQAPPPLEPHGEAQYWVTPIGADTPADRAESKLREYNNPTLKWLSIHEALPGHYVQFEHANQVQPADRRLLRALLGNGAYVEGWAEYIAQQMMDAGYQADDWRFRLSMRKIRLRLLANTILDVRLHTRNMNDAEAMQLMTGMAFQTSAEAEGKLRRAKLSAVQLSTYYAGLSGWQALRRDVEQRDGSAFNAQQFHDRALGEGPVPLAVLRTLFSLPAGPSAMH